MEMEKNYRINSLFEFYRPLLTNKQDSYIQLYYADDYSLGEISEEFNVSRQAVYDNIRRTEVILEKYEEQLHLYADFVKRNKQTDAIRNYVKDNYPNDDQLNQLVDDLEITEEK
ncbi:putative DNA-binding protein [Apilactobacillus kunkeei]|uniref:putative DNA-binding protein n=1 Tax=Apilactobacillus kunkeei TaxID=148814 RepID=UPI00110CE679|nr:putative DNA-binding protein [Apilactobacillus kunkeei]TMS99123.1 putative DNA-binding protein [Apilactobacillus kunkeei]